MTLAKRAARAILKVRRPEWDRMTIPKKWGEVIPKEKPKESSCNNGKTDV